MPRVLLLLPTTTYRTEAFMEAAVRLGVDVTVGSEEASTMTELNPAGLVTLDFAHPARAAQQVLEYAAKYPISAVIPVDDQVAAAGAAICECLNLPCNSVQAANASRNKHRMRELLGQAGVPQPRFRLCSFHEDRDKLSRLVRYPSVIKPLDLAASQGVMRVDREGEFVAAIARLEAIVQHVAANGSKQPETCHSPSSTDDRAISAEAGACPSQDARNSRPSPITTSFLVEDFVPGPEVAVEGILTRGRLRVLAIFDKPDPLDGPFFEETIYVTPSRHSADMQSSIADITLRACRALGLVHGPIHAELRLDLGAAYPAPVAGHRAPSVIEVNPRSIGGLCSRVLRFGAGLSLEELIIRHALDADFTPPDREGQATGVMMIPIPHGGELTEVRGVDAAKTVPHIEDVIISAHTGQTLVPLPEGSLYLGFIFARARTPEAIETALRTAHQRIEFHIDFKE